MLFLAAMPTLSTSLQVYLVTQIHNQVVTGCIHILILELAILIDSLNISTTITIAMNLLFYRLTFSNTGNVFK